MKHWLGVVMIVAACGGGGATSAGSAGAPSPGAKTQPVITEIPAAGGAKTTANELPDGVAALPTATPESMVEPPRPESTSAAPLTTLVGQAWYAGPACGWAAWPPQCNGPYQATWVWIWSHTTGSWLRAAKTDAWGRYTFYVEPGWYTIMLETGFANAWWHAKVSVPPFETTTQNLIVDYGVR